MSRNPDKQPTDTDPDAGRDDVTWRVVEAIEPEEDVLSKLAAEDEAGPPVAAVRPPAPPRRTALDRPVLLERISRPDPLAGPAPAGSLARPATPDRLTPQRQTPAERPAVPAPVQPLGGRAAAPSPGLAEREVRQAAPSRSRGILRWLLAVGTAVVLVVGVVIGLSLAGFRLPVPALTPPALGTLVIESRPSGAFVTVDGEARGQTPVSVALKPGTHTFVLTGTETREMTVSVDPGSRVVQYIEMREAPAGGTLRIETSTPGAQVSVDGSPRGATPLDVADLAPGEHAVTLRSAGSTVTENVTVKAGETVSLVVPLPRTEAVSPGWVAVTSPIELQVYEGDQLVGTSRANRVMMLAGRHVLRLANVGLGFETTRNVQVSSNGVTSVVVEPPNGVLFVNALPWAEVFMDGAKIGDTPIANYAAPIGSHEIVLRHPKFPERRMTVTVSLTAPARVGVDLQR